MNQLERNAAIAARFAAGGVTKAALSRAYGISVESVRFIVYRAERLARDQAQFEEVMRTVSRIEDVPIRLLYFLPTRARIRLPGDTVGDAIHLTTDELMQIDNFGRKSILQWQQCLTYLRKRLGIEPAAQDIVNALPTHPLLGRWILCSCGAPSCRRVYPSRIGTFYEGSGFEPEEARQLVRYLFPDLEQPSDDAPDDGSGGC